MKKLIILVLLVLFFAGCPPAGRVSDAKTPIFIAKGVLEDKTGSTVKLSGVIYDSKYNGYFYETVWITPRELSVGKTYSLYEGRNASSRVWRLQLEREGQ